MCRGKSLDQNIKDLNYTRCHINVQISLVIDSDTEKPDKNKLINFENKIPLVWFYLINFSN